MKINNNLKLIISIAICELAGVIGSIFTTPSVDSWYADLVRPEFAPPNWIFAPVWITLFALMGISAFLIWQKGLERREVKVALSVFIGQLVLNILWSIIFFSFHSPSKAFIEIIFLWIVIVITTVLFARISRPAAWLLAPYIIWVAFAGYLNYSIWQLNSVPTEDQIFCTMEAKMCPDGSYVGRSGPRCEFSPCPNGNGSSLK